MAHVKMLTLYAVLILQTCMSKEFIVVDKDKLEDTLTLSYFCAELNRNLFTTPRVLPHGRTF